MAPMDDQSEFYEDDEPAEKVWSAFEKAEKGVTQRPRDLNRLAASIVEDATTDHGGTAVHVGTAASLPTIEDVRIESEAERFRVVVTQRA